MLYEAAKYELKSPPASVSWIAIATETGALVAVTLLLLWLT